METAPHLFATTIECGRVDDDVQICQMLLRSAGQVPHMKHDNFCVSIYLLIYSRARTRSGDHI